MPLLWAIRETLGFPGTKFGCGVGICGACMVLVDGVAMPSCVVQLGSVEGADITTIEGVAADGVLSPVQQAWIDEQVPQCGYCQPGMIVAVTALLAATPSPSDDEIDETITNICRCGTYDRIRKGIRRAAEIMTAT
ncbi:MAG: (2Fe-2S)-binding protein [Aestuariivirgaceae bacterium]